MVAQELRYGILLLYRRHSKNQSRERAVFQMSLLNAIIKLEELIVSVQLVSKENGVTIIHSNATDALINCKRKLALYKI